MRNRSPFKDTILHILTAIVLFMKGIDKAEQGHYLPGILILASAVFITVYLLITMRTAGHPSKLTVSVYVCEALALALTGFVYLQEGKTYLPWVTFAAATGFVFAAIVFVRKRMRKEHLD